jgi:NADH-ubiquinone oxidoreductase chain 2
VWVGLEINLISFIPLMTQSWQFREGDAMVKYFLPQALGSGMLLLGGLLDVSFVYFFNFICLAFLVKMGAAPFHFWVPGVISGLS